MLSRVINPDGFLKSLNRKNHASLLQYISVVLTAFSKHIHTTLQDSKIMCKFNMPFDILVSMCCVLMITCHGYKTGRYPFTVWHHVLSVKCEIEDVVFKLRCAGCSKTIKNNTKCINPIRSRIIFSFI